MSWNHRIVRRKDPDGTLTFAVHEAYYDSEGRIYAITADSVAPMGDTPMELYQEFMTMKMMVMKDKDRSARILDYDAIPEPGAVSP